jgi:hypothetical protein
LRLKRNMTLLSMLSATIMATSWILSRNHDY